MSWCHGGIRFGRAAVEEEPSGSARLSIRIGELSLDAGGPADTCRYGEFSEAERSPFIGWLVLGLGIDAAGDRARFLDRRAWSRLLAPAEPLLDQIDGHYLIARWNAATIEFRCDPLGMRTLYLTSTTAGISFSTRLDRLACDAGGMAIDFASFGAHWLSQSKFSSRAVLEGVRRLGAGGIARCSRNGIEEISERPWAPPEGDEPRNPIEILDRLLAAAHTAPGGISLGLSGGMDSRVLLSTLIGGKYRCGLHVFGGPDHPDVRIARRMAVDAGLEILHLDEPLPLLEDARPMLGEYVGATGVLEPASSIARLRYYPRLAATGRVMIDGGLGEIARRHYGNRLLRVARSSIIRRDAAGIAPHLARARADVFEPGITAAMHAGMIAELEEFLESMPDANEIGAENFVDLLAIRTRFPHFAGAEQGRVDGVLPNFMPFAQPSFLASVLQLPLVERRNGRMFRRIIRNEAPALTRYPLVKSGIPHPYMLTTIPAWLWTRGRKMAGGTWRDTSVAGYLALMRDDIMQMLASSEVRSFAPYDMVKLTKLVEGYYAGDESLESALDWWLAFEVWRRGVGAI